ncbi:MAG: RidA family protein [Gaiellales bacterium]
MADSRIIPESPFAWAEGAPYSQAVRVGDLIFTSGQGGFDADGYLVDGVEAQLRLALANLDGSLRAAGSSLGSLVKITVYLADPADLDVWRRVRAETLSPPFPATTAVSTALLFDGMLCEIDAVAVVG